MLAYETLCVYHPEQPVVVILNEVKDLALFIRFFAHAQNDRKDAQNDSKDTRNVRKVL